MTIARDGITTQPICWRVPQGCPSAAKAGEVACRNGAAEAAPFQTRANSKEFNAGAEAPGYFPKESSTTLEADAFVRALLGLGGSAGDSGLGGAGSAVGGKMANEFH
jgi:hypothetical protein